jgi:iron(III) transport system ATP-binding protein
MADQIGVMKDGYLLQWDTADNLYYKPASYDVAKFVGEGSFVDATQNVSGVFESEIGTFKNNSLNNKSNLTSAILFIRPEDVYINNESCVKARLIKSHFRGPGRFHTFKLSSGTQLTCIDKCPKQVELNKEYGISVCTKNVAILN